jgi:CubicO group peptidase (beta-lactamase class C family)
MSSQLLSLAVTALLLAFPCRGVSQTTSIQHSHPLVEWSPARAGMSEERLTRIDTMIETAIGEHRIPGAVALVARHGGIVYHRAFGLADNETGRALQVDDIFRIASQTKAITSTAVMMLWEQGHFQLDDPIANWIPEFKDAGVLKTFNETDVTWTTEPARQPITIRHLLTHTSGIGYGVIDGDERIRTIYAKAGIIDLATTEPVTIGENVKNLAALPLHHHPGERYTYSQGLDVLGYFIEIISGKPYDVLLREHLFEPLGMNDTGFYLPAEKAARLVTLQKLDGDKWVRYPVTFYDPDYPIQGAQSFFSGGAGLCSTAKDYATFLQMYLNGGELNGVRILSRTTIETIMRNQTGDRFGGGNKHHGLAFGVLTEQGMARGGEGSTGTFDWGGYFNTQYFADPRESIVGVLLKQTRGANDNTAWKFRQMVGAAVDD